MPWPHADDIEPGDAINILGVDYVLYDTALRVGGTPSWNNKNPGNIVHSEGEAERYGAYPGKHNDNFAIFPTEETGFEVVKRFLRGREDKTILEMMRLYAPAGHGPNDPQAYAAHIARRLDVPTDTTVSSLDDDQLAAFAGQIQDIEGWREGRIHVPDDLPEHVDHWLTNFPTRIEREAADQPRVGAVPSNADAALAMAYEVLRERPVLLVVDDAHLLDGVSATLLLQLALDRVCSPFG